MPSIHGNGYQFDIVEWWGGPGYPFTAHENRDSKYHHEGEPSDGELLNEATRLTGRYTFDNGDTVHFTIHSIDGWTPEELESTVDDGSDYYEIAVGGGGPAPAPEPPAAPRAPRRPSAPPKAPKRGGKIWQAIRTRWHRFWRQ